MIEQFLGAIAFAGDLTMGQPPEHSPKTAWIAAKIVANMGGRKQEVERSAQLAMIRWSGCTANAVGFADLFGDDIGGRREVLAGRDPFIYRQKEKQNLLQAVFSKLPFVPIRSGNESFYSKVTPLVHSHCEVAAELARRACLSPELIEAIDDLFEYYDGSGWPNQKTGGEFDFCVQCVWLASDLEAFTRFHGAGAAKEMVRDRSNRIYANDLVEFACSNLDEWLHELGKLDVVDEALTMCGLDKVDEKLTLREIVLLLSDFADLKRPEIAGVSRLSGELAYKAALACKLSLDEAETIMHGAMLSSLGFVAFSSPLVDQFGANESEALRLVPYWSERILSRSSEFSDISVIAGQAFERIDGTGWYRGLRARDISMGARIVQVAYHVAFMKLTETGAEFKKQISGLSERAPFDQHAVAAVCAQFEDRSAREPYLQVEPLVMTTREREVLTQLVRGMSNKEIARRLAISPKTVNSHLENIFKKLGVSTRAAAAFKALEQGILQGID